MVLLNKEDLRKILSSKAWVSPHNKVLAMVDEKHGVVELVEEHARGTCFGGSAWSLYHYTKNSPSIFWSKREGTRIFYKIRSPTRGMAVPLTPSFSPASIDSVVIEGEKVKVTYSGLAGAGVATLTRAMAAGVEGVDVMDWGGGSKLGRATIILPKKEKIVIGVDDTDRRDEGATWSLVNEIAYNLSIEMGVDYLEHSIVQLYPQNPFKTQNCVSISVSFAVFPDQKFQLIESFRRRLEESTLSNETGMAVFHGVIVDERLMDFARKTKLGMVELDEALTVASKCKVDLVKFKGERGLIGALAAIPFVDSPDDAVRLEGTE
ncbi:MAG: methanogenesis marker protein 11 [Candidatus Methanomethylicaceae archaeon]